MNKLKTINEPLSTTPSKAIRQAVTDLEAVEASDDYFVNMDAWKEPGPSNCSVCMAGAVMQRRTGDDGFIKYEDPENCLELNPNHEQFYQIESFNHLRNYKIKWFLDFWLTDPDEIDRLVDAVHEHITTGQKPSYPENPDKFKANMLQIADVLEKEGY